MTTSPKPSGRSLPATRTPPRSPTETELTLPRSIPTPQVPLEVEPPSPERTRRSARIHLILGPVGAGKSTFAVGLAHEQHAVRLTLDEWMATLFRPDRPDEGAMAWYVERTARCLEQIWILSQRLIAVGTNVILEIGLLSRRDVRRRRVEERNRVRGATFSMVVPPEIFELASDLWEPPDRVECEGLEVHFVRTDRTSPE